MVGSLFLLVAAVVAILLLVGLVALGFLVVDRVVGRRGDRAVRRLNGQLSRGEITPEQYREAVAALERPTGRP